MTLPSPGRLRKTGSTPDLGEPDGHAGHRLICASVH